jgi:S-formylglutathione hydrolase FrmB
VADIHCDIFEPAKANGSQRVVLYLHDAADLWLPEIPSLVTCLAAHALTTIAPRTGRSWWNERSGAERFVMEQLLPTLNQRWQTPRTALLGVEMGGQGALRWSYKYPGQFPVVAAISPAIDHQILFDEDPQLQQMYTDPEAVRQDSATLHIHPLNWPRHQFFCCHPRDSLWWEGADRLRMKLASLGVPHSCDLETRAGEHADEYTSAMAEPAVAFLAAGLEQLQRSLL